MTGFKADGQLAVNSIKFGAVSGILACIVYPLMTLVPLPDRIAIVLASFFGPLLITASIGLYCLLALWRKTASLEVARVFNIVAGAMVTAMLIVQSAVYSAVEDFTRKGGVIEGSLKASWHFLDNVQLGLDITWDIFIALGTILFAINMFNHPRFGKLFWISGIIVGSMLLVFNLYTFPNPPANSGLIDLGPAVGMWYLVVSIQAIRSIRWAVTAE